ncbi:MAG: hypothetical protein J4O06_14485 [Chloroflexi bacterium]|nr:hypothetical protein [Chloroflexota bacterium]
MLDDLHWADKPSLLLLEFLARELSGARLLIIGTYRDVKLSRQHPLAESLGGLNRERLFQRVLLRGLSQEDVRRFIEIASGVAPPTGLVEAVHTQTEGNPLFVTEVVRLLVQEGNLVGQAQEQTHRSARTGGDEGADLGVRPSWTVRIPEGVREVIGRRLNRLSQRCNETLTMASVIGREFELRQLSPLIQDMSEDRLLEVLEEALGARVIEELPQAVGRYQFTHALIQETLSEELSTTRKVRLHARIAEMLEEMYGDEAESHAAELAHHYAQAEPVIGPDKLVRYSLMAGERALTTYAHEESQGYFERALAANGVPLSGTEPAIDSETAALLFGLGRTQSATGQLHEAWAKLGRAFDYYMEAGDVAKAVAVAEYPLFYVPGLQRATRMVEESVPLVPRDSLEYGRLLSRYGLLLNLATGDYKQAQSFFDQALVIANQNQDRALEMRTRGAAADAAWYHLDWPVVLENSVGAVELAHSADDPHAEIWPRYLATLALFVTGDPDGASVQAAAMLDLAGSLHNRGFLANALWLNGVLAYNKGELQASQELYDRALELVPDFGAALGFRALLACQMGEFGQGESDLGQLLAVMHATPPGPTSEYAVPAIILSMVAYITGVTDRLEVAEAAADIVLSSPSATPLVSNVSRVGLALIAVSRSHAAAAREHYATLDWMKGTMLGAQHLAGDRVLGLLAQAMGNLDLAESHFEDALAFYRERRHRPELAWTCCDYSDALRERDAEGDRAKAIALLDESLAISSKLGMRPLMERVLSRKLEIQGIASVNIRTSIDHVASAVTSERPDLPRLVGAAPDGTVTILFSDIEGSTQMTERLGDQRMQQVLRGHNEIVRRQVAAHGGFEVKSLGGRLHAGLLLRPPGPPMRHGHPEGICRPQPGACRGTGTSADWLAYRGACPGEGGLLWQERDPGVAHRGPGQRRGDTGVGAAEGANG